MASDTLTFVQDTAHQAGKLLCEFYHQQHTVRFKNSEFDVVTEADLASEQFMVNAIHTRFPDHAILSEEGLGGFSEVASQVPYLWVVDPLDGTVNYSRGYPHWGVTLALAENGRVTVCATYDPLRDEMFWAERDKGAWCNGERLNVSDTDKLANAVVATGFTYQRATSVDNNLAEFSAVMPRVRGIRRAGAAVLALAYVAAGRIDAYWELHLSPWDWATGWLLVEEAGGKATNRDGAPWSLDMNSIAVSNGVLHDELLTVLHSAQAP